MRDTKRYLNEFQYAGIYHTEDSFKFSRRALSLAVERHHLVECHIFRLRLLLAAQKRGLLAMHTYTAAIRLGRMTLFRAPSRLASRWMKSLRSLSRCWPLKADKRSLTLTSSLTAAVNDNFEPVDRAIMNKLCQSVMHLTLMPSRVIGRKPVSSYSNGDRSAVHTIQVSLEVGRSVHNCVYVHIYRIQSRCVLRRFLVIYNSCKVD